MLVSAPDASGNFSCSSRMCRSMVMTPDAGILWGSDTAISSLRLPVPVELCVDAVTEYAVVRVLEPQVHDVALRAQREPFRQAPLVAGRQVDRHSGVAPVIRSDRGDPRG